MELSFTMEQIDSIKVKDAGFMYKSHPSSRIVTSQFSFIHKTVYEFLLAYFINHTNLDSFKRRLYKNREILKQELSLTRFLLHLYMSPKEAFEFTTNIIASKPDKDLFTVLHKLYIGYKHDDYQTTLTFSEDKYCYIYQYPCYVICADRRHEDSLSSYNKDMIRRMNTDNKHKAVTVPILKTATRKTITCGDVWYLSDYDFHVYSRQDYELTRQGDARRMKTLYLKFKEKVGDIDLNPVNDYLEVNIGGTNLHKCVGLTKPWIALIQSFIIGSCNLEPGDISVIADNIQACTSQTGAESASPCRLQKLDLRENNLTGAGVDIARMIPYIPLCKLINLTLCHLSDEYFYAIVISVIQTGPATQLKRLYLRNNNFTNIKTVRLLLGNLPPFICVLYLDRNKFKEEDTQDIERLCKDKHPNLELEI